MATRVPSFGDHAERMDQRNVPQSRIPRDPEPRQHFRSPRRSITRLLPGRSCTNGLSRHEIPVRAFARSHAHVLNQLGADQRPRDRCLKADQFQESRQLG
jgi:hypothetical protein